MDLSNRLPQGSETARVTAFLDSRGMTHTELAPPHLREAWYVDAVATMEARGSNIATWLYSCSIYAEFKFDRSAKLSGHRTKMQCSDRWLG